MNQKLKRLYMEIWTVHNIQKLELRAMNLGLSSHNQEKITEPITR